MSAGDVSGGFGLVRGEGIGWIGKEHRRTQSRTPEVQVPRKGEVGGRSAELDRRVVDGKGGFGVELEARRAGDQEEEGDADSACQCGVPAKWGWWCMTRPTGTGQLCLHSRDAEEEDRKDQTPSRQPSDAA